MHCNKHAAPGAVMLPARTLGPKGIKLYAIRRVAAEPPGLDASSLTRAPFFFFGCNALPTLHHMAMPLTLSLSLSLSLSLCVYMYLAPPD